MITIITKFVNVTIIKPWCNVTVTITITVIVSSTITIIICHYNRKKAHIVSCFEQWEELLESASMGKICRATHILPCLKTLKI